MSTRRSVGIDLGTSNTVVACASSPDDVVVVPILQRSRASTSERLELLPSCAYAALPGEIEADEAFDEPGGWVLGEIAKLRGAEVPHRFIASSKSWLCHPRVDKTAAILPWGSEDGPKLSPVEVAARLLGHVAKAWSIDHPGAPLTEQDVILTVPASFDEVARELTLAAAVKAGLTVRLLEEPQAAFYDAMARGELTRLLATMGEQNATSLNVLVCDVGGGTTDLSLLEVRLMADREPLIRRVAVGSHLLLGGDNMDLALAHTLEPKLARAGEKLSASAFAELNLSCKRAKEKLLSGAGPEKTTITLLGRGSSLFAETKSVELSRAEAERIVLEGFLPRVDQNEPKPRARGGLIALGLPYERDVAITRHIAAFLARHLPAGESVGALLLNGGVFRSGAIAEAVTATVAALSGSEPFSIRLDDPDTSVAKGAAVFGLALRGQGRRITGGSARSFFVRVGQSPAGRPLAVCAVPKGAEEGVLQRAPNTVLKLTVGRPARFDIFTSDKTAALEAGAIVELDPDQYDVLPPLSTTLPSATSSTELAVTLESELTPVGTLDLHCVEQATSPDTPARRFRLAFDLRPAALDTAPSALRPRETANVDEALAAITRLYGKGTSSEARDAKNLQRELERLLGDRDDWSADTSRALAERLLAHAKGRKRTLDHERVFFQLVGFCLRPGVGAPGDAERVDAVAALFAERLGFPKEARTWQQFFICYRRIAAGLSEKSQLAMRDELDPFVAPGELKLKKPKSQKPESSDYEILELLAHLEHVPTPRRAELGAWILERTWTKRDPRLWAALGRAGARVPAYGSAHRVVSPLVVEKWIDHLLREKWGDLATAPRAIADMARMTGDRTRDVAPSVRAEVAQRLAKEGADPGLARAVREVVEVAREERAAFFGERLPPGLSL